VSTLAAKQILMCKLPTAEFICYTTSLFELNEQSTVTFNLVTTWQCYDSGVKSPRGEAATLNRHVFWIVSIYVSTAMFIHFRVEP